MGLETRPSFFPQSARGQGSFYSVLQMFYSFLHSPLTDLGECMCRFPTETFLYHETVSPSLVDIDIGTQEEWLTDLCADAFSKTSHA